MQPFPLSSCSHQFVHLVHIVLTRRPLSLRQYLQQPHFGPAVAQLLLEVQEVLLMASPLMTPKKFVYRHVPGLMEAALMLLWMLMLVEAFLDVLYEDHSEEIRSHASRPISGR
jgi:hypothetical protein